LVVGGADVVGGAEAAVVGGVEAGVDVGGGGVCDPLPGDGPPGRVVGKGGPAEGPLGGPSRFPWTAITIWGGRG
jgi:hypothetical protein